MKSREYRNGILDTTTRVTSIVEKDYAVRNPDKAFDSALRARNGQPVFVRFYGNGRKAVSKKYFPGSRAPWGLQCRFFFRVLRRSNGFVSLYAGTPLFSVNRSQLPTP